MNSNGTPPTVLALDSSARTRDLDQGALVTGIFAPLRAEQQGRRNAGVQLVPRHRGFDGLGVTENGQIFGSEEHLDAARDAWLAADVAEALQREDHLVHGRRAELEWRCMSVSAGGRPWTRV